MDADNPRDRISVSGEVDDKLDKIPCTVRVVGRQPGRENHDLQGEYQRISNFHGRPAYRKIGADTCIRYWSKHNRWLIDRNGLVESDICNAYSEPPGVQHPASEDLMWHVWETDRKQHVCDPDMVVTACPAVVQVVGRGRDMENFAINGEYRLVGLHQGRVAYQKENYKHALRYWTAGDRWLMDLDGFQAVDRCNAYADSNGAKHPGVHGLVWHVWDSQVNRHMLDPSVQTFDAPSVVAILGRERSKENSRMNGSYHLVGLYNGHPAYVKKDGSGHAIRYWPDEDRWLVDLGGLRNAGECNAYAEATESSGRAAPDQFLTWHVWETTRARHMTDPFVKSVISPQRLEVKGRDAQKENCAVNGIYRLADCVEGKPAYIKESKVDGNHVIRYWASHERWIIDLENGFSGCDMANAYADAKGSDSPANPELRWHVWDSNLGRHLIDEEMVSQEYCGKEKEEELCYYEKAKQTRDR